MNSPHVPDVLQHVAPRGQPAHPASGLHGAPLHGSAATPPDGQWPLQLPRPHLPGK